MSLYFLVLIWMSSLQPEAPWLESYPETAQAIADACDEEAEPLKCAAILVSLAWFESTFRPDATGDNGRAHGLYQSHHVKRGASVEEQTREALRHVKQSFRQCRDLTPYVSGKCGLGVKEAGYRMHLARRLWGA